MSETERSSRRIGGSLTTQAYLLFGLATVLGMAHHIDHVIRGTHVGWPVTAAVNPFTYSLASYPLVALGAVLAVVGVAGARYWAGGMMLGVGILVFFHRASGPWSLRHRLLHR